MDLKHHEEFIRYALRGESFGDSEKAQVIFGNIAQDTIYFNCSCCHFTRPGIVSGVDNIALNRVRSQYPHPLESDNGWGGGDKPWEIVDGERFYSAWTHGLAFTGGRMIYYAKCGFRQATIDFGLELSFKKAKIWHHGAEHIPKECRLQYWDGAKWTDIEATRKVDLSYPSHGAGAIPDSFEFEPIKSSKIRYCFDNCGKNLAGNTIEHGWIYEFEVYGSSPWAHRYYFDRAVRYLQSEKATVISEIARGRHTYARHSFGQALHTIQDLFAHSNYIDLNDADKNIILAALKGEPNKIAPRFFKLTYWRVGSSGRTDEYSHTKYNKDNPNRPGFDLAKAAAKECSKEFVFGVKMDVINSIGLTKWKKFRA